tara:strand:+ start:229 stop:669 length:441 start_codon:yes stop_codon:yes gene_type:complete
MRITATDLQELNILKYYRVVRKWACKQNNIKDADLELLIYLNSLNRFTINDFKQGTYIYCWDKKRWDRLRQNSWIDVWRHRNRTTIKYSVFKTSFKCNILINRIYKILLGEEDIPMTSSNIYYNNKSYTDVVMNKAIDDMIKDPER